MIVRQRFVQTAAQCATFARQFAHSLCTASLPLHIHLQGDLGAGKTFWAREVITALGGGRATSPTFAWALSYPEARPPVHHMDLFRLPAGALPPDELIELLAEPALCFIEWAERAVLPPPDVRLVFDFADDDEQGEKRCLTLHAPAAQTWAHDFS